MSRLLILIAALILSTNTHAAEFLGSDVSVFVSVETITNDQDAVQLGFTLDWNHIVLDFSHGVKRMKWRAPSEPQWEMNEWQSGSAVRARIYPFNTETFRPLIVWNHSSDATRGQPFNDKEEPTSDYFGVGMTIDTGRFEIDVTFGRVGRECNLFKCGMNAASNEFGIRFRGILFGARQ